MTQFFYLGNYFICILEGRDVLYPQLQYKLYNHVICNELLTWLPRG